MYNGNNQGVEPPRDSSGKFTDEEILEAFKAFDLDKNNFIGAAEIRHVLINIGEQVRTTQRLPFNYFGSIIFHIFFILLALHILFSILSLM